MKSFSEFGIKGKDKSFVGTKVPIEDLFNKTVIVKDYVIKPSRYENKGNGKCLYLQVFVDNCDHVVFTGSVHLQELIQQVPQDGFPFQTTIKRNQSKQFIFT